MNRFTHIYFQNEGYEIGGVNSDKRIKLALQKLGQLEDIEEELGIDLLTLFKVFENDSAWTLYDGILDKCDSVEYMLGEMFIYFYWNNGKHLVFALCEYGETWALTKEELENGRY